MSHNYRSGLFGKMKRDVSLEYRSLRKKRHGVSQTSVKNPEEVRALRTKGLRSEEFFDDIGVIVKKFKF